MTIWKYQLAITRHQIISVSKKHKILTIQVQQYQPCLWVVIEENGEFVEKPIFMLGTGHDGPPPEWNYIGTAQPGDGFVWHYFE